MYYTLIYCSTIDTERIDRIRRKYDPTVDRIAPHVTIMFPVPESIDEQALREAQALELDFSCLLDKLHLVKLVDDFSSIAPDKVFP